MNKESNEQKLSKKATLELSDETLDTVTGGAKFPYDLSTPPPCQDPKQSILTSAPYGSEEWWKAYRAAQTTPPPIGDEQ